MSIEASTNTPAGLMKLFSKYASEGDVEALLSLYEPNAVFQPEFGATIRGYAQLRPANEEFLAFKPRISYTSDPEVLIVEDIALVTNFWTMTAALPDGTDMTDGGTSADVLRRQSDGTWRVLIDQPRGVSQQG